ncbi:conserved membrane hypothetical protein [Hyella patelloides LEGE 07179]|uniref:Uncharacterized protein n=1 Tax=Hyella patelloides LEGE 07179 TaxID=945734 RepID=A0A563VXR7_9CYAN|nr:ABC transporter permease subunit [Hyella patelloides]VEP16226.1 conserved membrane hypothetical protein [Hyella patelloides LEGE 07179]
MTQYMKPTNKLIDYVNRFGGWNPQFLREIKGKLTIKNVIVITTIAIFSQLFIVIANLAKLPDASQEISHNSSELIYSAIPQYSRYCIGKASDSLLCHQDMHNNWVINWQLFWFDIFVTLSVIGTVLLLVLGTYLLINNAIAEQKQGTLNLIRLSPQSAESILVGKILGVPILLYLFVALGLPLQIISGLQANLSLSLVIAFDLAVMASCAFFYSVGLLVSFVANKSVVSWGVAIAIAFFLGLTTILNLDHYQSNTQTLLDWLLLFNPLNLIIYIGQTTGIPYHHFDYPDFGFFGSYLSGYDYDKNYIEPIALSNLLFYGKALWTKVGFGIGLMIANHCLWSYWIWQGLKRRFYNPENTAISKQQSYWITGYCVAVALGFSLQGTENGQGTGEWLFFNIILVQLLLLILFLGFTFALSPQHQTLQDWARYRHQMGNKRSVLWRELILGEKSPSTFAIAINILIATLYIIPSLIIFPFDDMAISAFWGLILTMGMVLFYSAIVQWILFSKSNHKEIIASGVIISLIVLPPLLLSLKGLYVGEAPLTWMFTFVPYAAIEYATPCTIALGILGQWLAITLVSLQMTRQLRQAGRSESYRILKNG